jgi:hypothetical protein
MAARPNHRTRADGGDAIREASSRLNERSQISAVVASIRRIGAAAERSRSAARAPEAGITRHLNLTTLLQKGPDNFTRTISQHYQMGPGQAPSNSSDPNNTKRGASFIDLLSGLGRVLRAPAGERLSPARMQSIASIRGAGGRLPVERAKLVEADGQRRALGDLISGPGARAARASARQSPERTAKARSYPPSAGPSPSAIWNTRNAQPSGLAAAYANAPTRSSWQLLKDIISAFGQRPSGEEFSDRGAPMKVDGLLHKRYGSQAPETVSMSARRAALNNGRARTGISGFSGRLTFSRRPGDMPALYRNPAARSGPSRPAASASELVRQLRTQRSALRPTPPADTVVSRPKESRLDASEAHAPLVVNFSPTIVIQGRMEAGNIERTVIQAIRLHSHELVHIINRELQTQRRAAF